jgi:APA family basic amino acid/polyamine antiporter
LTLARRGVFPQWFGKVNSRGMPVRAQVLSSTLSVLLVAANYTRGLTELFAFMALLATVATLVLYLFATIAALRLMARGEMSRGLLLITLVGGAYAVWTFYGAGTEATLWGLLLMMTAIPVWFGMRLNSLWSSPATVVAPASPPESSS